jgi:hypothetical protein
MSNGGVRVRRSCIMLTSLWRHPMTHTPRATPFLLPLSTTSSIPRCVLSPSSPESCSSTPEHQVAAQLPNTKLQLNSRTPSCSSTPEHQVAAQLPNTKFLLASSKETTHTGDVQNDTHAGVCECKQGTDAPRPRHVQDWVLDATSQTLRTFHMLLFVPSSNHTPLHILDTHGHPLSPPSFLVAGWGGVCIYEGAEDFHASSTSAVTVQQLKVSGRAPAYTGRTHCARSRLHLWLQSAISHEHIVSPLGRVGLNSVNFHEHIVSTCSRTSWLDILVLCALRHVCVKGKFPRAFEALVTSQLYACTRAWVLHIPPHGYILIFHTCTTRCVQGPLQVLMGHIRRLLGVDPGPMSHWWACYHSSFDSKQLRAPA